MSGARALIFSCLFLSLPLWLEARNLEDIAQVYVDEYFEPSAALMVSEPGRLKAEALAHFSTGRIQEGRNRPDLAIESYLKVLELQPGQLELARKCARMLAQSNRSAQGRTLLEESLKMNAGNPFAYFMLSEFLLSYNPANDQTLKERSLSLAQEAVEKFPTDALSYEHLAEMYLMGRRQSDVEGLLRKALRSTSQDPRFWLRLGKVASRVWSVRPGMNGAEVATLNQFFAKAINHAGSREDISETVGDYYRDTNQFDKAEEIYRSIIKRRPDRQDLRENLAAIYKKKGEVEKYIATLEEIVQINPNDLLAHRKLAEVFKEQGDNRKAIKHQRTALRIGKGSDREYYNVALEMEELASELRKQGLKDEAKAIYEETISFAKEAAYLFPENPDFLYLITFPLRNLDRHKESIKYFESCEKLAAEHKPDMLQERFYFQFGATAEASGDVDRAAKLFQKTIEILGRKNPDPTDIQDRKFTATVYNYLGYMWVENDKNILEGGELIKQAIELDPDSAAIRDSLGWFYFKIGNYEAANKELLRSEELLKSDPDFEETDPVILDHIARSYYALGNKPMALQYMENAVKKDPQKKEFQDRLKLYQSDAPPQPEPLPPGIKPVTATAPPGV